MLESLAWVDCVTNIANRRRDNEALDSECKRAARANLPLALIMLDIDDFKAYNDSYGHGAGDACLRQVAAALADVATFRPADLVARCGGEEFVALLPETDAARRAAGHRTARQSRPHALPGQSQRPQPRLRRGAVAPGPTFCSQLNTYRSRARSCGRDSRRRPFRAAAARGGTSSR